MLLIPEERFRSAKYPIPGKFSLQLWVMMHKCLYCLATGKADFCCDIFIQRHGQLEKCNSFFFFFPSLFIFFFNYSKRPAVVVSKVFHIFFSFSFPFFLGGGVEGWRAREGVLWGLNIVFVGQRKGKTSSQQPAPVVVSHNFVVFCSISAQCHGL